MLNRTKVILIFTCNCNFKMFFKILTFNQDFDENSSIYKDTFSYPKEKITNLNLIFKN